MELENPRRRGGERNGGGEEARENDTLPTARTPPLKLQELAIRFPIDRIAALLDFVFVG